MIEQKVISVTRSDGAYYNFFFTPGAINSMASLIEKGWRLKFIKDDPQAERAVAVFEREI
jgi:hypothetical protein